MGSIEQWWVEGEQVPLTLSGVERAVFVRRLGAGPEMTLLHGFPSSSHDWAKIAPALAVRYSLTMPDFLGFGASEKPAEHQYSLHEQADLVEAMWAREGVSSAIVVAHDYAVSVTQELLARRAEGALGVDLRAVHLLNGGLYPDLHRPQPVQTALLDPEQGPQVSALINEELFVQGLRPTFAEGFDGAAGSAEIWQAMSRDGGQQIIAPAHRLHERPRNTRTALGGGDALNRCAAVVRLGNARPDIRRAHGAADPRAFAQRAVARVGGRRTLAAAGSA